jgi:hypothetical protein
MRPFDPNRTEKLIEQSEEQRLRLIESEFTFAHTYCDLAETEAKLGNRKHAQELVAKVRQAVGVAKHHMERARTTRPEHDDMRRQLDQVEERLQAVSNQVA